MRRLLVAVALAVLVASAGCHSVLPHGAQPAGPEDAGTEPGAAEVTPTATPDGPANATATAAATPTPDEPAGARPDPENDTLGWENGYWYDDPVDVDRSDGLNESELAAVVARAMARVEHIRKLEFERTVPVEIIPRSELGGGSGGGGSVPELYRLRRNTIWEAPFFIGERTDAVGGEQSTRSATIGGYYDPGEERIVVVSDNETAPKLSEVTLAQELFHALQDQRFDLGSYDRSTMDRRAGVNGIVEGDATLVDRLYERRCEAEWDCLRDPSTPGGDGDGGGGSPDINFGLYLTSFQPYSDGPAFVRQRYRAGGWDAVNEVYADPPASSEQVIHPEKYGEDAPAEMTFVDRSDDDWQIAKLRGRPAYETFGEAGLAVMLFYPYYDSNGTETPLVEPGEFFNRTADGEISSVDPIDYETRYTTGWDGDRLYPYVNASWAETGETAYVWKIAWDTSGDAEEFAGAYRELLDHYGAEPVDGRPDTYRIPEGEPFADAFRVVVDGDTVYVVNAPTVGELDSVRRRADG